VNYREGSLTINSYQLCWLRPFFTSQKIQRGTTSAPAETS